MLLKASRITNLTDARYFAAKEVDYLGFNLEEGTPGYLDPMYMKAIREWVEGPQVVGEFSNAPIPVVREAAAFFGLDAVQLSARVHGDSLPELAGLTILLDIDLYFDASVWPSLLARSADHVAAYIVPVDVQNWTAMKDFLIEHAAQYPLLLRVDAPAAVVETMLAEVEPAGLDFTGGEEEQVGVKSFDQLEELFELLGR